MGALARYILNDLARAHPDIRECVSRIDVMRFGHAMARPVPGSIFSEVADTIHEAARSSLVRALGRKRIFGIRRSPVSRCHCCG